MRTAQALQRLRQPGTGDHLRPIGVGSDLRIVIGNACARKHPHGLGEAQPFFICGSLDFLEPLHHAPQMLAVDFDPTPAHQGQTIRLAQEPGDFRICQRLAIERNFGAEIK